MRHGGLLAIRLARIAAFALVPFLTCAAPLPADAQAATAKPAVSQAKPKTAAPAVPKDAAAIDQLFRGAVKPGEPGIAVIVTRKGLSLHRAAHRMANVELGVALTPEHVFRIGSVTKQFTSAAILMLAEESKLAVSDPITTFMPDYPTQGKTHTRYDVAEEVTAKRAAGYGRTGARIVNAQYLSMTQPYAAGALMSTVDDLAKWDAAIAAPRVLNAISLAKAFTSYKLTSGSGSGYGSGWGIGRYEGLAVQEHGGGIPGFRACVVRLPSDGVHVAVLSNPAAAEPDLGLLARKAAAIAIGKPLLNPPAIALTAEQLEPLVGRYVTPSGTRPAVTRDGNRLFLQRGDGGKSEVFLAGNDVFFVQDAFTRFTFQRDAAGKYTRIETDDWGPQPPAVRDTTPEKTRTEVKLEPAVLNACVGEYELAPGFVIAITLEGEKLMAQATGQPKIEIFASAPAEFFLKVVDAHISFVKDASGAVTQLVLHQGGQDMPGRKIK